MQPVVIVTILFLISVSYVQILLLLSNLGSWVKEVARFQLCYHNVENKINHGRSVLTIILPTQR